MVHSVVSRELNRKPCCTRNVSLWVRHSFKASSMLCWRTLPLGRHDALLDLGTTPGHRSGQRKSKQKPLPVHGCSLDAFPRSPLHPRGWMEQRRQSFVEKGAGWFLCNWSLSKTSSHKCFHLWSSIMRLQFFQYVAPLPYTLIWFLLVIRLRQLRVLNHILSSMIGGSALHMFFRSLENQSLVWRNKLGWVLLAGVEPQVPSLCHRDGPSFLSSLHSSIRRIICCLMSLPAFWVH